VIDHVNNLKLQYLVELSKLGDRCAEIERQTASWLHQHDVAFAGQTIPFVLMPHFVSPGQARRIRHAVQSLARVLDRFCDAYPTDAALRAELDLPAAVDALVRIEPGFPNPLRVCRLDAFLQAYDVKFLEFNGDSPAGVGYTDVLYEGLREAVELPRVTEEFDTAYTPMLPELLRTLVDAYAHVRARHADLPEVPRLALLDAPGSPAVPEFRIICEAARGAGLEAVFATTADAVYDGSRLHVAGAPVDLVYRRALVHDIVEGDLVTAARDGRVAVVNPFRARIASNKKILALLQDPRFAHLILREEEATIRETIPWTRVLRPGKVTYESWIVDLLSFVSDNRERLVLKPAAAYGGRGVALGSETGQDEWDGIIEAHAEAGDWVVQEYIPVPEEMFPVIEDGHVQMRLKRFNINPFALGGRYAGMLTRISDRAVINVSAGGGLLPSVTGRHKRRLLAEDEGTHEETLHDTAP
jgi:hypothetical protein